MCLWLGTCPGTICSLSLHWVSNLFWFFYCNHCIIIGLPSNTLYLFLVTVSFHLQSLIFIYFFIVLHGHMCIQFFLFEKLFLFFSGIQILSLWFVGMIGASSYARSSFPLWSFSAPRTWAPGSLGIELIGPLAIELSHYILLSHYGEPSKPQGCLRVVRPEVMWTHTHSVNLSSL